MRKQAEQIVNDMIANGECKVSERNDMIESVIRWLENRNSRITHE
jgi:hypothetical protein